MKKFTKISGLLLISVLIFIFRFDILYSIQNWKYQRLPNQEKIWAHRVNSIQRLEYLQEDYAGVEADLFFDTLSKHVIINHPPSTYKELSLETWLQHHNNSRKVWFDLKLLDSSNVDTVIQELEKLSIDRKAIFFECYDLYAANIFSKYGFQVVLNVDASIINGSDNQKKIYQSSLPDGIQFVSQEDVYIDSLKSMFPEKKIMTWSTSFYHIFNAERLKKLLNDEQVQVVLVNVKSKGYL